MPAVTVGELTKEIHFEMAMAGSRGRGLGTDMRATTPLCLKSEQRAERSRKERLGDGLGNELADVGDDDSDKQRAA